VNASSADSPVAQARRWYWQRISAMVLALCVGVHLAVMVYAVRGGLDAAEILARTQGSVAFGLFYTVFVIAAAVHVPPGLMNIAVEWWRWPPRRALWAGRAVALLLVVTGLRAVYAVVIA
jgi:fumarate reductase subunit C